MNFGRKALTTVCAAAAAAATFSLQAQDLSQYPVLTGQPYVVPGTLGGNTAEFGQGGRLYGSLDLMGNYSSNFYYTNDGDHNKVTAWGGSASPTLVWEDTVPRLDVKVGGNGQFAMFNTPGSLDNYGDGTLFTSAIWRPLRVAEVSGRASFQFGHDPFGTNRTENPGLSAATIDEWDLQTYSVNGLIGVGPHLSLQAIASYLDKHYTTNQDGSALLPGTKYEDFSTFVGEFTGFYEISPRTQMLLDFIGSRFWLPNIFPSFPDVGGTSYQVRGGVRWSATPTLSGDVRLGYVYRTFNQSGTSSFERPDWQATLTWRPRPYREVTLETAQRSIENYQIGNQALFINNRYVALRWSESLTPYYNTSLVGNYVNSNFVDAVPSRTDNNFFLTWYNTYAITRTISLIGYAVFGRRYSNFVDSGQGILDYSRADVYFGVRLTPFGGRLSNMFAPAEPVQVVPELPES